MSAHRLNPPVLFRAFAPLFRVPGPTQVLDVKGGVTGVAGVPGFYCAHVGVGVHGSSGYSASSGQPGGIQPLIPDPGVGWCQPSDRPESKGLVTMTRSGDKPTWVVSPSDDLR